MSRRYIYFGSFASATWFSDDYGMPLVLYSLRKLTPNSSNCIRVRRSSDNTETNIGFVANTPNSPIDTTALLSFVGSGNGFITTWYDQSTNNFNSIQTIASAQPRIVLSGVVDLSSLKSSLRWVNGSNQRLISTFSATSQPITVFSVAQLSQSTGIDASVLFDSNSANPFIFYSRGNSETPNNVWRISAPLGIDLVSTTANVNLFSLLYNGASSSAYINNSLVGSGDFGSGSLTNLTIGNLRNNLVPTYDWSGWISELIIFNSNQITNRTAIETNINTYYNVF